MTRNGSQSRRAARDLEQAEQAADGSTVVLSVDGGRGSIDEVLATVRGEP